MTSVEEQTDTVVVATAVAASSATEREKRPRPSKLPNKAKKPKQALPDSHMPNQEEATQPDSPFDLDRMMSEGMFTQDGVLGPTQEHIGNMTSIGQGQLQEQFNVDAQGNLTSAEMGDSNQVNFADFDDMVALLGRTPLQSSLPVGLNKTQDSALQQHLPSPMSGSQTNIEVQSELGSGRVVGLEYFIRQSDQANVDTELLNGGPTSGSIPPGLIICKDALSSKFIGVNSTGATVASSLRLSIDGQRDIAESDVLSYLIGAVEHTDEVGVSPDFVDTNYQLPDRALAAHAYFRNVHAIYPIVNDQTLQHSWLQFYESEAPERDPVVYSRFFLLVAIGALSAPRPPDLAFSTDAMPQGLYQQAWRMFNDVIARPYASSVQVILLHVIYLIHFSKSGIAWVLCGLAIRIAQSIGLHRKTPPELGLPQEEMRLRSQIWWICYTLDAFLSTTQGRHPAAYDSCCDVELLPLLSNPASPSDTTVRTPPEIYIWYVKLAKIKNTFCNLFGTAESAISRADKVSQLDAALTNWRDEIPLEYRPDQEILAPRETYHFIAMLHLHYFNILQAIHWTSLVCARQNGITLSLHPNPRIRSSEAICVAAARAFVKTLNDMSNELEHSQFIPICFHTDHYMAAISVLFENIFRYPHRLSARTDLEFLRAGEFHFERHVHPLRFNSQLGRLFQKMQAAAEELLKQPGSSNSSAISVRSLERHNDLESERTGSGDKGGASLDFESLFSPRFFMFGTDQGQAQHIEVLLS
ncbi:uncharacterized protein PAC_05446 [Phialocephala subalpina]|uniref:Xylanolytic transcriptional activator regulatory domain-containing protein n=1 Tax=Phialocephala subalpina TaxID=576137 RepID=A0A1L7WS05_9HELO|nr:uncharacterized protein PAC_05446 [Phialocephala subalpina]